MDDPSACGAFVRALDALVDRSGCKYEGIAGPERSVGGTIAALLAGRKEFPRVRGLPSHARKREFFVRPPLVDDWIGCRWLYVDSVITTGQGIIDAVTTLRDLGVQVAGVAACVARSPQAYEQLRERLTAKDVSTVVVLGMGNFKPVTWLPGAEPCPLCQLVYSEDLS